ncbi:glycosyltransferase [Anaeromyxobacter diazotrophicus]|uniref:Glycosyl transferase n=1 Tax=Anaeromyxobacter diazotrophicus TaxID=2590199 RepID=A0A7I9VHP5_9BACT|nr:glycosyltransferase [Anaeromyxobacter diazotrophicus]GEJ55650.1 glycosyl transferase [Anaeromyxobacter diazotrophicus]
MIVRALEETAAREDGAQERSGRTRAPGRRSASIAVIIPCLQEALTIAAVVADFRRELPEATIVVVDNGSTDETGAIAEAAGAVVLRESRRGKGYAVRKGFREVDADVYLLVDGDGTYPASAARLLLRPVLDDQADVVIGGRLDGASASEFRWMNRLGNRLFLATVNAIFRARISDLLTGYRAMSREFVRRSPILSGGFELETELTIVALDRGFRTVEIPVRLTCRPPGSTSKIRVIGDGLRILAAIFALLRDYRPLTFFGGMGLGIMMAGLCPGAYVTWEFLHTHEVRIPTAVLATGLELLGMTLITSGVILTTLSRRFREIDYRLDGLERDLARPRLPPSETLPG